MSGKCDNRSAGVIVTDGRGRFLVFDRAMFPAGTAPPAGHVDGHGGWEDAARAEVSEETGLTVVSLTPLTGGWRDNACRREPGPRGTGHEWRVFLATVTGELAPSPRETRNARWLGRRDLQRLAARTADRAVGLVTAADFAERPGIEPVWVRWLADAGLVILPAAALAAIEALAAIPPDASREAS